MSYKIFCKIFPKIFWCIAYNLYKFYSQWNFFHDNWLFIVSVINWPEFWSSVPSVPKKAFGWLEFPTFWLRICSNYAHCFFFSYPLFLSNFRYSKIEFSPFEFFHERKMTKSQDIPMILLCAIIKINIRCDIFYK